MDLLRGDAARQALAALVAEDQNPVALEINPEARTGGALLVLCFANAARAILVNPQSLASDLLNVAPLYAAYEAKAVHRALLRAALAVPDRWACLKLSEQLLAGGRDWGLTLEGIAARLQVGAVPSAESGMRELSERTRIMARLVAMQALAIKRDQLSWASRIESGCIAALAELEHHGMPLDAKTWRALTQQLEDERALLRQELAAQLGTSSHKDLFGQSAINLDSDQELKVVLRALGLEVPDLKRHTVERMPAPWNRLLGRYRELGKLVSSYGNAFVDHVQPDGRVHPTFDQIGASTGRMACHAPNLQAVVKDAPFRACFRAPSNRTFVIADYATCELRILAEMSGDPVFLEAFARGEDLHARVATSLFATPVSKTERPESRQRAKAVNFGLVYGMGAQGLAHTLDIEVEQARGLLEQYFRTFPKIGGFLEETSRQAVERGFAQTLTGRRLYLALGDDRSSQAAALRLAKNMPVQGTSADIIKIALSRLRHALAAFGSAHIVNVVHDEVVVECEGPTSPDILAVVTREMRAAGADVLKKVSLDVEAEISPAWSV